jgi:hypothetical protein
MNHVYDLIVASEIFMLTLSIVNYDNSVLVQIKLEMVSLNYIFQYMYRKTIYEVSVSPLLPFLTFWQYIML